MRRGGRAAAISRRRVGIDGIRRYGGAGRCRGVRRCGNRGRYALACAIGGTGTWQTGDDVAGEALGDLFPDGVAGGIKSVRAAGRRGDGESARKSGREAARTIAIRTTPRMTGRENDAAGGKRTHAMVHRWKTVRKRPITSGGCIFRYRGTGAIVDSQLIGSSNGASILLDVEMTKCNLRHDI